MKRLSRLVVPLVCALWAVPGGMAQAQWGFPGGFGGFCWGGWGVGTAQGDIARGMGLYAQGLGFYERIKMRWACFAGKMGMLLVAIGSLTLPPVAPGQDTDQDKARPPAPKVAGSAGAEETVQAIDDEYNRQLLHLEQRRLEQLGRLAARQQPALAAATYERLFRLAIAGDLFRDAEAAAVKVVEQGTPSPTTDALAHLVKIIAEVERGAFEQSLQSLRRAIAESTQEKQATEARAALAPAEVIGICEAYYQRLVEGNQFAIAREAFRLVLEQPYSPAVKDFLASRLKRIE